MLKAVYIYDGIIDNSIPLSNESNGVVRKVKMQLQAFAELGVDISVWSPKVSSKRKVVRKIFSRLPLFPINSLWDTNPNLECCDFIYIRKSSIDLWFVKFLKRIKESHPKTKIILEIPTFPYDGELSTASLYPLLLKERFWQKALKDFVDRIVTYSVHSTIWGIPTIRVQNGIDVGSIPMRKVSNGKTAIDLLGVAVFSPWHGYDRLINGLGDYYDSGRCETVEINLHLVGDGPDKENYVKLARKRGLAANIEFYGSLSGGELDSVFDVCDIAIASLGIHRINLKQVSTLKAREYCARGIPFIKSYEDISFDGKGFDFACTFPADETPISIEKIIGFYGQINERYGMDAASRIMRCFSEVNLSWKKQMEPVLQFCKK